MRIDLIFTSQPNIVANAGFHLSLHPNCHHQTVFAKFILNLPPYLREVLHYKDENEIEAKANPDLIKGAIRYVYWEKAFSNTFSVLMSFSFNKIILNFLNNSILHETRICNDKDPLWFNSRIKSLIENKNKLCKNYQRFKSNSQLLSQLNLLPEQLRFLINKSKKYYLARTASKLTNVQKNSKTCWSILNCFLNNKKHPLIPPLLHENKFLIDFKDKAKRFNAFFAKQCSLIKNSSKLHSHLHYLNYDRLSSVSFSQEVLLK